MSYYGVIRLINYLYTNHFRKTNTVANNSSHKVTGPHVNGFGMELAVISSICRLIKQYKKYLDRNNYYYDLKLI